MESIEFQSDNSNTNSNSNNNNSNSNSNSNSNNNNSNSNSNNNNNSNSNSDFKDLLISELKKQNESLFELHREKLEEEVRNQMAIFFDTLSQTQVNTSKENQNIAYILSKGSRPNTSYGNNNNNDNYIHTRPQTSQGSMQIRASLESSILETMKRPVTVSTTTGRNKTNTNTTTTNNNKPTRKKHIVEELYEKIIKKEDKKPIFKTSKAIVHPPHLAEKYNAPIFPINNNNNNNNNNKIKKKKDTSYDDINNDKNTININKSNNDNDNDKYISQMNRRTQLMIRKSETLIKEGVKAKKYRIKRQKQYESWLKSEDETDNKYYDNDDNENNNDDNDDEIVEEDNIEEGSIERVAIERLSLSPLKPLNTLQRKEMFETNMNISDGNNTVNPLSPRWREQTVEPVGAEPIADFRSKADWENNLARYILSVFASKNRASYSASTNGRALKSDTIVDYVDLPKKENVNKIVSFMEQNEKDRIGKSEDVDNVTTNQRPSTTGSSFRRRFESINSTNSSSSRPHSAVEKPLYEPDAKFRRSMVIRNEKGEEVTVRTAPRVSPIWFISAGDIYADWTALPDGAKVQAQLSNFYEHRKFLEYFQVIEMILLGLWDKLYPLDINSRFFLDKRYSLRPTVKDCLQTRRRNRGRSSNSPSKEETFNLNDDWGIDDNYNTQSASMTMYNHQFIMEHWRRLIITGNAVSILCVEKSRFDIALNLLNKIKDWLGRDDILPADVREELVGHVSDTRSYYFYKKQKYGSAVYEIQRAKKIHEKYGNTEEATINILRLATIECMQSKFKESHKRLYEFLSIIEDGKLGLNNANAKQLCLVAIAYHNLAVIQMKLQVPDLAVRSSQSARKIARLCLSYSNRWIETFQWTHDAAMDDCNFLFSLEKGLDKEQAQTVKQLLNTAFNPD